MSVEQQAIINAEARALPGGNRHAGGAEKRRSGSARDATINRNINRSTIATERNSIE
jgi:hypothetical protein